MLPSLVCQDFSLMHRSYFVCSDVIVFFRICSEVIILTSFFKTMTYNVLKKMCQITVVDFGSYTNFNVKISFTFAYVQ